MKRTKHNTPFAVYWSLLNSRQYRVNLDGFSFAQANKAYESGVSVREAHELAYAAHANRVQNHFDRVDARIDRIMTELQQRSEPA